VYMDKCPCVCIHKWTSVYGVRDCVLWPPISVHVCVYTSVRVYVVYMYMCPSHTYRYGHIHVYTHVSGHRCTDIQVYSHTDIAIDIAIYRHRDTPVFQDIHT
jgi:hypothetical protein